MYKYYIRLEEEGFGFVADGVHEILPTDKEISIEDYDTFFEMQTQGKQFIISNRNGTSLFEILEEYTPPNINPIPTMEDRISALEEAMLLLL